MARIDDYRAALELGKKGLYGKDPNQIAEQSGADIETNSQGKTLFNLDFLNRKVVITWPALDFSFKMSDEEISIQQQVLILHYLYGCEGLEIAGEWIAYQEVPDGRFYLDAFLRRAKNPMVQSFGDKPELLVELATRAYGARRLDHGDFSVVVQAFPKVPVALILWKGDDEFPPEGNILFDKNISGILSAEDIAWLGGMVVYPLIGMSKGH